MHVPREKIIVILILFSDNNITDVMNFYNTANSGVDTACEMCTTCNVSRNIKCWPMAIFFMMIKKGGINSRRI